MLHLSSNISELNRVGKTNYILLKKLGLETIQDLLFYFPWRYDDFQESKNIQDIKIGEKINIIGVIDLIQNKRSYKKRMYITEAIVVNNDEVIKVIWFNQAYLTKTLHPGDKVSLSGKVLFQQGQLTLISPIYERIIGNKTIHTQGLVPVYHTTNKLSQKQLRFLINQSLILKNKLLDWIPEHIRKKLSLITIQEAVYKIHFPRTQKDISEAKQRLGFAELFLRQIKAQIMRQGLKNRSAYPINFREKSVKQLVNSLPFKLTLSQKKVAWEIIKDMEKSSPMSRLVEGDVGSGKTLVAIIAMLNTALNNKKSILMAPTEILAQQHYHYVSKILKSFNIKIALLTKNNKLNNYSKIDIIIGTQAIIQKGVEIDNIALTIIDEQHRFGVKQRKQILDINPNNITPHFLSLSATPIPRSLALAIYGDLNLSIINELPKERKKIITKIIAHQEKEKVYQFIEKEIMKGRQAFVVCPQIDQSDRLGINSAKAEFKKLSEDIFPHLNIGLIHGKIKNKEKEKIMKDVAHNKIQILVSTSIIEVGINIPNATIILIEGADHFGLAQLHQFRGRINRSSHQAYCFLSLSNENTNNPITIQRLSALEKHNDGFTISKIDLRLRGSGEIYGINQSGFPELKIASLFDYELIKKAQIEAKTIVETDPLLNNYPKIKEKLGSWDQKIHLE